MRAVVSKILHTESYVILKKPGIWNIMLIQIRVTGDWISKRLSLVPTVFISRGKKPANHILLVLVLLCSVF